jgi:putative membrane protein
VEPEAHHVGSVASAFLFLLLVAVPLGVLAAYLFAAWQQDSRSGWSRSRSASFAIGIAMIVGAVLPVGEWQQGMRGHTLQHLLLGMFAPLALVMGAPVTLLLRSVPASIGRVIANLLRRRAVIVLTHPVTALLLNTGGMYLLYLTPLFATSTTGGPLHVLVHVHFVVAGYLFAWAIAGPDPAPCRPRMPARLAVLFIATAAHAILAKIMYGYGFPRGVGASATELQSAATWMYYGGDAAELLLIVAFVAAWFSARRGRAREPRSLVERWVLGPAGG